MHLRKRQSRFLKACCVSRHSINGPCKSGWSDGLANTQAFLGFGNFYCCFIKDFSKIAWPLFNLTRKDNHWKWDEACKEAFQSLKEAFTCWITQNHIEWK